jgi:hypothetical protein
LRRAEQNYAEFSKIGDDRDLVRTCWSSVDLGTARQAQTQNYDHSQNPTGAPRHRPQKLRQQTLYIHPTEYDAAASEKERYE